MTPSRMVVMPHGLATIAPELPHEVTTLFASNDPTRLRLMQAFVAIYKDWAQRAPVG